MKCPYEVKSYLSAVVDTNSIVDSGTIVLGVSVTAILPTAMVTATGCERIAAMLNGRELQHGKDMSFNLFHRAKNWMNHLQHRAGDNAFNLSEN
jgi:hypothetical protein